MRQSLKIICNCLEIDLSHTRDSLLYLNKVLNLFEDVLYQKMI